jgi:cytoskeletal protein CcmA (bactofilin family)
MSSRKLKRLSMFGIAAVVLLLITSLVTPAMAGETRQGQRVTVAANEVIPDDLYCFGETIIIDGTVKGDLVAAGSEIRINGTVEGDVLAAARTIIINGVVKDDARMAGMDVQIAEKAQVGDDVNVAAFNFNSRPGSQIGGDLYARTYQSQVDGHVAGNVFGAMNALIIGGQIGGNVTVEVGEPDPQFGQIAPLMQFSPVPLLPAGLTVTESAQIGGKLTYTSAGAGSIAQKAGVNEIVRQTPIPHEKPVEAPQSAQEKRSLEWLVAWWFLEQLRRLVTLIFIGLMLVWLAPTFLPQVAARLRQRFWPSLGWGCLGEIVFAVGMAIAFVLIIAIGLFLGLVTLGGLQGFFIITGLLIQALVAVAFIFANMYITKLVVAFAVGVWLLEQARSKQSASRIWPVLIGILLFVLLRAIPFAGGLIDFFATLFGLGALWLWLRDRLWPSQPQWAAVPDAIPPSFESTDLEDAVTLHDIPIPADLVTTTAVEEAGQPSPLPEADVQPAQEPPEPVAEAGAAGTAEVLPEPPVEESEPAPSSPAEETAEAVETVSPAEEGQNGSSSKDEATPSLKHGDDV